MVLAVTKIFKFEKTNILILLYPLSFTKQGYITIKWPQERLANNMEKGENVGL